jgi:PTH1 family peptidyl-tRNA hydrolase
MALFSFIQRLFRSNIPPRRANVLFFGLGNIGGQYARSRHNIGFRVAGSITQKFGNPRSGRTSGADYTSGMLFDTKTAVVVKPRTLMNRSGLAVAGFLRACSCPVSNMLVIVDDYHLPLGKIRARRNGSDGGHNGLKSVIGQIGEQFPRLRIGIGPLPANAGSVEFVLGDFTPDEERLLLDIVPMAAAACVLFAEQGIDAVMNTYNT